MTVSLDENGAADDDVDVIELETDADWAALLARYDGRPMRPYERCLEVAREAGAASVVIEANYHDDDYRSEYYALFAQLFPTVPDGADRLIFFDASVARDQLANLPPGLHCVGYITIRPHRLGLVGRTVLQPPPDLASAVTTAVTDTIHLYGQRFEVTGVPFMQQDKQLARCAQASAWMCHYTAARRGDVRRRPVADFSVHADRTTAQGRMMPSDGLTVTQLISLMDAFELPPILYRMGSMPSPGRDKPPPVGHDSGAPPGTWDHRAISVACRYLNSGYPVLIGTEDHAFVLCGYERSVRDDDPDWITFVRHDDQRGPYLRVDNILADQDPDTGVIYGPWETMLIPVPNDLWLQPEAAEDVARQYLPAYSDYAAVDGVVDLLADAFARDALAFRTYAISQNDYKARLAGRGSIAPDLMQRLRFARMSRMVWVVEAIDRDLRRTEQPSVIGEAIYDATSADGAPGLLAIWAGGRVWVADTTGTGRFDVPTHPGPLASLANRQP